MSNQNAQNAGGRAAEAAKQARHHGANNVDSATAVVRAAPYKPIPAKTAVPAPQTAAKGDDDVMSQEKKS